jgi:hypothetical protein
VWRRGTFGARESVGSTANPYFVYTKKVSPRARLSRALGEHVRVGRERAASVHAVLRDPRKSEIFQFFHDNTALTFDSGPKEPVDDSKTDEVNPPKADQRSIDDFILNDLPAQLDASIVQRASPSNLRGLP